MPESLYESVVHCMNDTGIHFEESKHEPVFTSESASKVSGHPEEEGTKSLVLQTSTGDLVVATVCGDERLDFYAVKELLRVKKVKMCSEQVLSAKLHTELGGVAPFGYSQEIQLVVSSRLFSQQSVYFNGGRNDVTFQIRGSDFERVMRAHRAIVLPPAAGHPTSNVNDK